MFPASSTQQEDFEGHGEEGKSTDSRSGKRE